MEQGNGTSVWETPKIRFEQAEENELTRRYYRMLLKWIPFADRHFEEWDAMPNCGYFFGGAYWYGLDTARTIPVYAVLSVMGEFDEAIAGCSRERLAERAIKGIRYLSYTHDAGPAHLVRVKGTNPYCSERKWGGQGDNTFMATQTGYSVSSLALAAWVLWDRLDDETRTLVRNVVVHYADRWCDAEPLDGVYYNTQVEENSWTAQGIAAAADLFIRHPRREHWLRRFRKWAANSVTTFRDWFNGELQSHTDRNHAIPLPFISTSTVHPDFTTENHGFVHPTYLVLGINQRAAHALFALMSGRPIEPFALLNNEPLYDRTIKMCCQRDGFMVPVQGQDWWYNRQHELLLTHAILNVVHRNADAARLERLALSKVEQLQASHANGCFLEENGEQRVIREGYQTARDFENWAAQDMLWCYLLHAFGGIGAEPSDETEMWRRFSGVSHYPYGGFIVHRTPNAFSSFSWRNDVMGLTLGEPGIWLTAPVHASMTGIIKVREGGGIPGLRNEDVIRDTEEASVVPYEDGFGAVVRIERGGGAVEQEAAFVALPDGRAVYVEKLRALRDCTVTESRTGLVGVRNERYRAVPECAGGVRTLYIPGGSVTFAGYYGDEPDEERAFPPMEYVNVDDRIGYLLFGSTGVRYVNKHRYKRWKGIENLLVLNDKEPLQWRAGDVLPPFAVVVLPNRSTAETAAARAATRLLSKPEDPFVLLECENTLVYAHFGRERATLRGEWQGAERTIRLYEGIHQVRGTRVVWSGTSEARRSGYRVGAVRLVLEQPLAEGFAFDVAVAGDQVYVMNCGVRTVRGELVADDTPDSRPVAVEPGSFAAWPLPLMG